MLTELNRRLIEDERAPNSMNLRQLAERMAQWLAEGYTCYLATEAGETVAYCLFRDDGDYYYLRQLYVERRHRRTGIATRLLDWMFANVWLAKPVRLEVFVHNATAIAFYRAYGFRVGVLRMEKPPGPHGG